jgi:hypothetical protein
MTPPRAPSSSFCSRRSSRWGHPDDAQLRQETHERLQADRQEDLTAAEPEDRVRLVGEISSRAGSGESFVLTVSPHSRQQ